MDFQDLYQELATPLGLRPTSTKLLAERKLWINRAYRELAVMFEWPNSHEGEFQTTAPYSTGTVSATKGDTAVTLSGGTWTATSGTERRRILIGNVSYRLSDVSTSDCTLEKGAVDDYSGEEYVLYQAEYDLPNTVAEISEMWVDRNAPLGRIRGPEMSRRLGLENFLGSPPTHFEKLGLDAEADVIVRLHGYPAGLYQVHYLYRARPATLSADADVPIVLPLDAHYLIALLAEVHLQRFEGEAKDVKLAREAFHETYSAFIVGFGETMQLELDPAMFRMEDGIG